MKVNGIGSFSKLCYTPEKMVGIESTLDLSEDTKKVKKPEVADAEKERQKKIL